MFLVAILPPEPVFAQIWSMKQEVHRLTGSRNAVRLPPHITLIPPLHQPDSLEAKLRAALAEFAGTQAGFVVGLRDFAWFGSRTLYVEVAQAEAVRAFHAALTQWCAAHLPEVTAEERPFTPHLTLATRDLPTAAVPELRRLFADRRYAATFEARSFTLFRHDGQQWLAVETFELGG